MENPDHPIFQIVEARSDNQFAGRNCGSDILVGTVFTRLVEQEFYTDSSGRRSMKERTMSNSLHLTVAKIEAYSKSIPILSPSWTALITLSGQGLDLLIAPSTNHVYLCLQAPK